MVIRKSKATMLLEDLTGGPLNLGRYICSIREGEEMSQVEFTRKLGLSMSHLCDIEKGRKSVSAARAAEIARILGYSEKQFVLLALQDSLKRAGLDYHVRISAT